MCCRSPAITWRSSAGVVFFIVRGRCLRCFQRWPWRHPIKKWGGDAGARRRDLSIWSSPAPRWRRSARYIMTAVVLIGVMADSGGPSTMRTIAVAALAVMLIVPEAVIHPSFQMSFAADLGV